MSPAPQPGERWMRHYDGRYVIVETVTARYVHARVVLTARPTRVLLADWRTRYSRRESA